jgi:hypothetical protein
MEGVAIVLSLALCLERLAPPTRGCQLDNRLVTAAAVLSPPTSIVARLVRIIPALEGADEGPKLGYR